MLYSYWALSSIAVKLNLLAYKGHHDLKMVTKKQYNQIYLELRVQFQLTLVVKSGPVFLTFLLSFNLIYKCLKKNALRDKRLYKTTLFGFLRNLKFKRSVTGSTNRLNVFAESIYQL